MVGVDAQFIRYRCSRRVGLASQEVTDLLASQAARVTERFERTEPLAQLCLHILAMNGDHVHAG